MGGHLSKLCTAFVGSKSLLSGSLADVALAAKAEADRNPSVALLVFDDVSGRVIDLDLRGTTADVVQRLATQTRSSDGQRPPREAAVDVEDQLSPPRARGRPKLGVISREVTLLPRHWEWLATQPGGASAVLRRLVDQARRDGGSRKDRRAAHEAAYHFMQAMVGDLPHYEEALRALFADDREKLEHLTQGWPKDVRAHICLLAFGADGPSQ